MKKAAKVFNTLLSVVLTLVLVLAGYILVSVLRTEKGKVPSVFGYSFMRVASGSMEPTIPTGALIIVQKTEAKQIEVGDIICFYSEDPQILGKPNTHRVVKVETAEDGLPQFTTMGDAIGAQDPYPVHAEQIVGIFVRSLQIGKVLDIIQNRYFFFFVLFVPLCIIIFFEFLRVKKIAAEKEEQKNV